MIDFTRDPIAHTTRDIQNDAQSPAVNRGSIIGTSERRTGKDNVGRRKVGGGETLKNRAYAIPQFNIVRTGQRRSRIRPPLNVKGNIIHAGKVAGDVIEFYVDKIVLDPTSRPHVIR